MTQSVRKLEEILLPKYLGENKKIIQCDTNRLTVAGENYGSLMLTVDLKIKDTVNGKEHILNVVAKTVPNNEVIRRMFQSHITFKKELAFYRTVLPTLKEFQKEAGVVDLLFFFPEFCGGRLGLGPNLDTFDDNAVILLENLKMRGFACADRRIGFNLEMAKSILKDLSTFHAVPIALKLNNPEVFQKKVRPYLDHVFAFNDFGDNVGNLGSMMFDEILKIGAECPRCVPYLKRLRDRLEIAFKWFKNPTPPREPFATIAHSDFWINNIMVKTVDDKPISNKIVDYQFFEYNSPTKDLILFIFDSVQNQVVVENYDHLVKFYHQNFIDTLTKFNVDTERFSFDKLEQEINLGTKEFAIAQCLIMIRPMYAGEDAVKDVEVVSEKDFVEYHEVPQAHKEKLWMIIEEFGKRGWL